MYCGHEYTLKNIEFAKTVDKDNKFLVERDQICRRLRANGQPTVPGTVKEELETNPFMRVDDPSFQALVGAEDGVSAMATIRQRKDAFK